MTNSTESEVEVSGQALYVTADGDTDGVSIHAKSKTEPLDGIPAGETVETWLIFVTPPDANLGFTATQWADHEFELTHDPDLGIALSEYEG